MKKNAGKGAAKGAAKGAGKAKSNVCPLWCTLFPSVPMFISLILLILIGLGGIIKNDNNLNDLYFMRLNTSDTWQDNSSPATLPDVQPRRAAEHLPSTATEIIKAQDFYHVGLWNYCSGPFKKDVVPTEIRFDRRDASKTDNVTDCTDSHFHFWFNIMEVQGLNQTVDSVLDAQELNKALGTYKRVTNWMNTAYVLGVVSVTLGIISTYFAVKSRRNMSISTGITFLSSIFLLALAITAHVLYAFLVRTFNRVLTTHHIRSSMGYEVYVLLWLAFALSLVSGLLWLLIARLLFGGKKGYQSLHPTPGPVTQTPGHHQHNIQNVFIAAPGNQSTPHLSQYGP